MTLAKSAAVAAKTKSLKSPSPRSAKASTKHDTLLKLLRQDGHDSGRTGQVQLRLIRARSRNPAT